MRPLLRHLLALARETLFMLGVWRPKLDRCLADSVAEFVLANKKYWQESPGTPATILVEGHLSQYGPNYLLRTAVAALALQEKIKGEIEVIYDGYRHQWMLADQVYRSFGIHRGIHLGNLFFFRNIFFLVSALVFAIRLRTKLKSPDDILGIDFDSLRVGDLIYDDIIRSKRCHTVDRLDYKTIIAIVKSRYYYSQYTLLFRSRPYRFYVSTHSAYSEYGLLCRVALVNKVRVIETTDIQMSSFSQISNDGLPTYHEGIRRSIAQALDEPAQSLDILLDEARQSLGRRLNGDIAQLDVQKAFAGRLYSRSELCRELGSDPGHKIVFILAHVFSDSPHISSKTLYADYFQWLQQTLRVCATTEGITWVVKPHPSSDLYGESGAVAAMVRALGARDVFICPDRLNTKSIADSADAIVTVHGTAGLEFSCLGIPALLAGKPFYSGFGFTTDPATVADYEASLHALKDVSPLSPRQVETALQIYGLWNRQFDWDNPIISSELLALVWGSGRERNLAEAYRQMARSLRECNPRQLKLWAFAQSCVI